ncbi:hypothetical protein [Escherichia coli]|uniref:hypothetical protein n=1 Tax=Escherichia coli TaxID=562 RepID=UPI0015EF3467|nr:hypothetical protein [Escherichia coli]
MDISTQGPDQSLGYQIDEPIYAAVFLRAYFHERRSLNNFHRDRVITFEQIAE